MVERSHRKIDALSLFVENLSDKHAILSAQNESANPFDGTDARATIARPRLIGLTLGAEF